MSNDQVRQKVWARRNQGRPRLLYVWLDRSHQNGFLLT
jgi:hypothetical protein